MLFQNLRPFSPENVQATVAFFRSTGQPTLVKLDDASGVSVILHPVPATHAVEFTCLRPLVDGGWEECPLTDTERGVYMRWVEQTLLDVCLAWKAADAPPGIPTDSVGPE